MSLQPTPRSKELRVAFKAGQNAAEKGEPNITPHTWDSLMSAWFCIGFLSHGDAGTSQTLHDAAQRQQARLV